ncbi:MAG TPA: ankyrin repeat domain-containing protein [Chthoniobacterales bacterium]
MSGQITAACLLGGFAFLGMTDVGSAPEKAGEISPNQFVRAVSGQQLHVADLYLTRGMNVNARAGQDRTLLLSAILQGDKPMTQRLITAGACVDLADENGFTPLMAAALNGDVETVQQLLPLATNPAATDHSGRTALHYAMAAGKRNVVEILLPTIPNLARPAKDGRSVISLALEQESPELVDLVLEHLPRGGDWTADTLEILKAAISVGHKDQIKMLLSRYDAPPPFAAGKNVPLLAHEVASGNVSSSRLLLECGADANTVLPDKCDPDFLAVLPPKLRSYIDGDKGVTILTLAAGLGQCDMVRALMDGGADRNRATLRFKMLPLYVAAETGKWQCAQILLGGGPSPDQLRIEISLASQRAAVIKDGVSVFNTICSTGRSGYSTRTGDFVITDKDRSHRSTIYKVEMPYFMRLSCLDFGMHEGVVPNYPASHGCIRLPGEAARKLFAEIPVGTLVTVK